MIYLVTNIIGGRRAEEAARWCCAKRQQGKVQEFGKKQVIFSQGDAADSVVYVQRDSVKFAVVNEIGKEAVV